MSSSYRICIAEDHAILRSGLRAILAQHPEFNIVGEAADGMELISMVRELKPDIILTDLSMPRMNGLAAIKEIKRQQPAAKLLVLTMHAEEEYVISALAAGANGYLLKDATQPELVMAIHTVLADKVYLTPGISANILKGYLESKKSLVADASAVILTQREKDVLKLIAEGYKNREIADMMHKSIKTIESHRGNLMKKLDCHNAAELTAYAVHHGLVEKAYTPPWANNF
jgi:two-component system, NarL family, response regulator NreC